MNSIQRKKEKRDKLFEKRVANSGFFAKIPEEVLSNIIEFGGWKEYKHLIRTCKMLYIEISYKTAFRLRDQSFKIYECSYELDMYFGLFSVIIKPNKVPETDNDKEICLAFSSNLKIIKYKLVNNIVINSINIGGIILYIESLNNLGFKNVEIRVSNTRFIVNKIVNNIRESVCFIETNRCHRGRANLLDMQLAILKQKLDRDDEFTISKEDLKLLIENL